MKFNEDAWKIKFNEIKRDLTKLVENLTKLIENLTKFRENLNKVGGKT